MTGTGQTSKLVSEWISSGGCASDGTLYGPADEARQWGSAGCPLVPKFQRVSDGDLPLPPTLSQELGYPALRVSDLDATVLDGFNQRWLPTNVEAVLKRFLLRLVAPSDTTVLPAGIPIGWAVKLPVSSATRNALVAVWDLHGRPESFERRITIGEIAQVEGVQPFHITEFLCVLESAECNVGLNEACPPTSLGRTDEGTKFWETVQVQASQITHVTVEYREELVRFCTWALSETDAATVGDAINLATAAGSSNSLWDSFANLRLTGVGEIVPHPYSILAIWADHLRDREKKIFDLRIASAGRPHTLQELGMAIGVTRERVRQLESRIREQLARFLTTREAAPIRWRAEAIDGMVGAAAPFKHIRTLLTPDPGDWDYRSILLGVAGPYAFADGWVIRQSKMASDPTARVIASADEVGRISKERAKSQLEQWGLLPQFHRRWLLRDGKVRELNGQWYRWDGSIADKLVAGLDDLGLPATIETLMAHIQTDRARGSALNALASDGRVVRINQTEWGLTSWGYQQFSSIAAAIRDHLEQAGEPVPLPELIARLSRQFELRESSIRTYCEAPIFVMEGGYVRLRSENEDYSIPNSPIRSAKGVFYLGPQRVARLLEVNADLLRGSGHTLTHAAGAVLNVVPDDELTFYDADGISVKVTFPGTSTMGPSLGSVKTLAEKHGANLGDYLTVILDRSEMSITAISTKVHQHQPGWTLLSRLVGLQEGHGISSLHGVLDCLPGEEREVLARRGDEVVRYALPTLDDSPGLDEALSALQAEFQRTRRPSR